MCGVAGVYDPAGRYPTEMLKASVERMTASLAHRGPDGGAIWTSSAGRTVFGHRRLAIIDLSASGAQPMQMGDDCLAFNGEIYNYKELAGNLTGDFNRNSDTAVLLRALHSAEPSRVLGRLNGMYAFAYWCAAQRILSICRDPVGIKPLYYVAHDGALWFCSELRGFLEVPQLSATFDSGALDYFLELGYWPGAATGIQGIRKLLPGQILHFDARSVPRLERPGQTAAATAIEPDDGLSLARTAVDDAVRIEMRADVPVGAFLSGGVDSSLVVSSMIRCTELPVRTFSIGFSDQTRDEAPFAKAIAQHLGTQHTELYVSETELLRLVPDIAKVYDEALADSSQVPTMLVCRLAHQAGMKVILSGDGGDELFGGYTRYRIFQRLVQLSRMVPCFAGRAIRRTARSARRLPWRVHGCGTALARIARVGGMLCAATQQQRYFELCRNSPLSPRNTDDSHTVGHLWAGDPDADDGDAVAWAMLADRAEYLPNDLLTKVDRASMSVGLEVRVPLLNAYVRDAAAALPQAWKYGAGLQKVALKQILAERVPTTLFERPKHGFSVPLAAWLRGPLRSWAESVLFESRALAIREQLGSPWLAQRWREHQEGYADNQHALWAAISLLAWADQHSIG